MHFLVFCTQIKVLFFPHFYQHFIKIPQMATFIMRNINRMKKNSIYINRLSEPLFMLFSPTKKKKRPPHLMYKNIYIFNIEVYFFQLGKIYTKNMRKVHPIHILFILCFIMHIRNFLLLFFCSI